MGMVAWRRGGGGWAEQNSGSLDVADSLAIVRVFVALSAGGAPAWSCRKRTAQCEGGGLGLAWLGFGLGWAQVGVGCAGEERRAGAHVGTVSVTDGRAPPVHAGARREGSAVQWQGSSEWRFLPSACRVHRARCVLY